MNRIYQAPNGCLFRVVALYHDSFLAIDIHGRKYRTEYSVISQCRLVKAL